MSLKVESYSTSPMHISPTSTTINDLPNELMLSIIQLLGIKDCLSSRLTCHHWKAIVGNPITIFSRYIQEIDAIKKLPLVKPECSAWEAMPQHWGLIARENVLKLSSCSSDIITFHPPFCQQSSKFFSFSSLIPLSDRYIFLAKYGNTYFLTEQGQTRLQLELATDLKPHASYKLITKNFQDPSKNRELSLLGSLPATPNNLSRCQIEDCFPITENKIVVITCSGEISCWDLSEDTPVCYQSLQTRAESKAYKIGRNLILNNKIINLITWSVSEHGFSFEHQMVTTYGSALCAHDINSKKIRYFSLSHTGMFEKQWDFNVDNLLKLLDHGNGSILNLRVQDMNDQYIVVNCWQRKALNLWVLTATGEFIHTICQKLTDVEVDTPTMYQYPHFSHLSGNILAYKHPQKHTLYFWHIPTKRLVQELEWIKLIYDMPLYLDYGLVQNVRLHESKLTILLSSQHESGSNKPGKFRVVQFDSQSISQHGWMNRIFSIIPSLYYAFPGKLSY